MLVLFFYLIIFFILGLFLSQIEIKIDTLKIELQDSIERTLEKITHANAKENLKKILNSNTKINLKIYVRLYFFIKIISFNLIKEECEYKFYLNIFNKKIDILKYFKNKLNKIEINKNFIKKTINYIEQIKKLEIRNSDTNLKLIIGTSNMFITSIIVPIISNIIIEILTNKKEVINKINFPIINIFPDYSENITLKIFLKTTLKIKFYNILKIVNINFKERKNNRKYVLEGE